MLIRAHIRDVTDTFHTLSCVRLHTKIPTKEHQHLCHQLSSCKDLQWLHPCFQHQKATVWLVCITVGQWWKELKQEQAPRCQGLLWWRAGRWSHESSMLIELIEGRLKLEAPMWASAFESGKENISGWLAELPCGAEGRLGQMDHAEILCWLCRRIITANNQGNSVKSFEGQVWLSLVWNGNRGVSS